MSSREPINIMIVDGHSAIIHALTDFLKTVPTFNVVAGVKTLAEARHVAQCNTLHLVTIDIRLPDGNGINLAMELGTSHPDLATLAYTSDDKVETVKQARNAGVRGYVLKGAELQRLTLAIEVVLAGGIYLDPDLPKKPMPEGEKLTPTEDKVMALRQMDDD